MVESRRPVHALLTAALFVSFLVFYHYTSNMLPRTAGPDWGASMGVARFILGHGRLAALPDDEDEVQFTPYGGSRVLRPPFAFIVSALTAQALSWTSHDLQWRLRKGSALLCALTVALAFHALLVYFGSWRIGLMGALLIGLLPQFTFIASYINDDAGAIFSTTLMIMALVRIYRMGPTLVNTVWLGAAGGLVVLSKFSAWLIMPFVVLFLLAFVRLPVKVLIKRVLIALVTFIAAGGWWLLFNMYHYGVSDPLAMKITAQMIEKHRTLPPELGHGFAAQGIGFNELILQNYKNFLGETAKATIGNLDWLKLRMGPLQYGFYLSIFFLAVGYWLGSLLSWPAKILAGSSLPGEDRRRILFESLLMGMIVFQVFMYTWTNIHNDIQIQGKYILPVFLPILLLFFSAFGWLDRAWFTLKQWLPTRRPALLDSRSLAYAGAVLFVLYVHLNAWINYVIPFYRPPVYMVDIGEYKSVDLVPSLHRAANHLDMRYLDGQVEYIPTGIDPKVNFSPDLCRAIRGSSVLRLYIQADAADTLQIFIDEGKGYSGKHVYTYKYDRGDNLIEFAITYKQCRRIRLDPAMKPTRVVLERMEIAPLTIVPRKATQADEE